MNCLSCWFLIHQLQDTRQTNVHKIAGSRYVQMVSNWRSKVDPGDVFRVRAFDRCGSFCSVAYTQFSKAYFYLLFFYVLYHQSLTGQGVEPRRLYCLINWVTPILLWNINLSFYWPLRFAFTLSPNSTYGVYFCLSLHIGRSVKVSSFSSSSVIQSSNYRHRFKIIIENFNTKYTQTRAT